MRKVELSAVTTVISDFLNQMIILKSFNSMLYVSKRFLDFRSATNLITFLKGTQHYFKTIYTYQIK